jgi:hypothetical protein
MADSDATVQVLVERILRRIPEDLYIAFSDLRPAEMATLPPFAEWADDLIAIEPLWDQYWSDWSPDPSKPASPSPAPTE